MKIVLRPGHGLTPPGPLAYSRYTKTNKNKSDTSFSEWHLQRPGNEEDLYTARFCGYLIPELVKDGHCVLPQRAIDPISGELDRTLVEIGPHIFPQLNEKQIKVAERWQYNAAVEAVLRGTMTAEWGRGYGWSHDPVASAQWERKMGGDIYLSIHQNWYNNPDYYGCAVYHCTGSTKGAAFANEIYASIVDEFRSDPWAAGAVEPWGSDKHFKLQKEGSRWGVYHDKYTELSATKAPAVIVELAFASNAGDIARMINPDWCGRMSSAIARGISA